jgi:hypothetical protein
LVVYLKWTKIVEVDENCRFIIKFLKEVNDLWRKKFKLFNKGTNCLLSIENKYQNIVLRFIHLWRHIRKPVKWTKTTDVALLEMYLFHWSLHVCFISVTNCCNVKCSLCQYMSMYVYHVNNGDGNLNCIICAWSFCLRLWQINMLKLNYYL